MSLGRFSVPSKFGGGTGPGKFDTVQEQAAPAPAADAITAEDILKMAVGRTTPDLTYDANQDGKITASDALAFQKEQSRYKYNPDSVLQTPLYGDLKNFQWAGKLIAGVGDETPYDLTTRYAALFNTDQGQFTFIPEEVVSKGYIQATANRQNYLPAFLNPTFNAEFQKVAQPVDLKGIIDDQSWGYINNPRPLTAEQAKNSVFSEDFGYGWSGKGWLVPQATSDKWSNDGYYAVKNYEIGQKVGNVTFGALQGMGKMGDSYVYLPQASGPRDAYGYITTGDSQNLKAGWTECGILGCSVGKAISGIANAIGQIPFLTEALMFVHPVAYGAVKGAQLGSTGMDPLEAGVRVGASVAIQQAGPGVLGDVLPSGIATIPGVTQGLATTGAALATGASPEEAALSGIISGGIAAAGAGGPSADADMQPGGFYGGPSDVGAPIGGSVSPVTPSELDVSPISGDVVPGVGAEVFPIGAPSQFDITTLPPTTVSQTSPTFGAQPINLYRFDDGSTLQYFDDGSILSTDINGLPSFSPGTDVTGLGAFDPNAPGFGTGMPGQPAPIESREDQIPPATGEEPSTLESMGNLAGAVGSLAMANPLTTALAVNALASGLQEEPKTQEQAEPPPKVYQYRGPVAPRQSVGLQEISRASDTIYGPQGAGFFQFNAPGAFAGAPAAQAPLLGPRAPGGLSSLQPRLQSMSTGQTFDISQLSPEQIIQLQNQIERRLFT